MGFLDEYQKAYEALHEQPGAHESVTFSVTSSSRDAATNFAASLEGTTQFATLGEGDEPGVPHVAVFEMSVRMPLPGVEDARVVIVSTADNTYARSMSSEHGTWYVNPGPFALEQLMGGGRGTFITSEEHGTAELDGETVDVYTAEMVRGTDSQSTAKLNAALEDAPRSFSLFKTLGNFPADVPLTMMVSVGADGVLRSVKVSVDFEQRDTSLEPHEVSSALNPGKLSDEERDEIVDDYARFLSEGDEGLGEQPGIMVRTRIRAAHTCTPTDSGITVEEEIRPDGSLLLRVFGQDIETQNVVGAQPPPPGMDDAISAAQDEAMATVFRAALPPGFLDGPGDLDGGSPYFD